MGGGTFGYDYNTADTLESSIPAETLRAAFKSGMTAIDTSPYYTISETVIGKALQQISDEFPRESYVIITKAGRYPDSRTSFDYTRERVRASVKRSCELLGTTYVDGCYMHDVSSNPQCPVSPVLIHFLVSGGVCRESSEDRRRVVEC